MCRGSASVELRTWVEHQVVPGGWRPYTQSTQELWVTLVRSNKEGYTVRRFEIWYKYYYGLYQNSKLYCTLCLCSLTPWNVKGNTQAWPAAGPPVVMQPARESFFLNNRFEGFEWCDLNS